MKNNLNIACIETDIIWENPKENRILLGQLISSLPQNTDIVLLPEMFTTGFTMNNQEWAEPHNSTTVEWMKKYSSKFEILLGGSIIVCENEHFYNRFYLISPEGEVLYYDKRHLFRMGEENKHYTAGTERKIIYYKGWRILPQICYDLRFPVWTRNQNDYDLLIYIANFPSRRQKIWETLLSARAIENQCFVVGCNRRGTDGVGIHYSGNSQIISPMGEIISQKSKKNTDTIIGSISMKKLLDLRKQFPVLLDTDEFKIFQTKKDLPIK